MTTASANTYTYAVTYNSSNFTYTISTSANFRLMWTTYYGTNPDDDGWYYLGFGALTAASVPDPDTAYALTHTSSGAGTLGFQVLWLQIQPIAAGDIMTTSGAASIAAVIPVTGNPGDIIQYFPNSHYECVLFQGDNGSHVRQFLVTLRDPENRLVDLRGVEMSLTLSYLLWGEGR